MRATQMNLGLTHMGIMKEHVFVCAITSHCGILFKVFFFGFTLFPSTFKHFTKHASEIQFLIHFTFVNQKIVNRSNSAKANYSFEINWVLCVNLNFYYE